MSNNQVIVHDKPKNVLIKFTVRASSLDEAKKKFQEAYPNIDVDKNFVYGEEHKELKQAKLF